MFLCQVEHGNDSMICMNCEISILKYQLFETKIVKHHPPVVESDHASLPADTATTAHQKKFVSGKTSKKFAPFPKKEKFKIGDQIQYLDETSNRLKPCTFLGPVGNGKFKVSVLGVGFIYLGRQLLFADNNE